MECLYLYFEHGNVVDVSTDEVSWMGCHIRNGDGLLAEIWWGKRHLPNHHGQRIGSVTTALYNLDWIIYCLVYAYFNKCDDLAHPRTHSAVVTIHWLL